MIMDSVFSIFACVREIANGIIHGYVATKICAQER